MASDKNKKGGVMRLDKLLTQMGYGSRSQVKEMARKGRVKVNGQIEKSPERKVDPEADQILVDDELVIYAKMEYYMLNKPQGVVSATEDGRYPTVVGLIGDAVRKDLFPVGRLDIDTEGLLLITNDGAMAHNLLSPKKHVDKTYLACVKGQLPQDAAERFRQGIVLEDGTKTRPAKLVIKQVFEERPGEACLADGSWDVAAELTIHEGKFHQVKRMFEAVGCKVVYLKRLSMGPLTLDESLLPGQYRPLKEEELLALRVCMGAEREEK